MVEAKIRQELKKLADSPFLGKISKQVNMYENQLKKLVVDFESKASQNSKQYLDKLSNKLKRTGTDVEKRILKLLSHERSRLTMAWDYLRDVSRQSDKIFTARPAKSTGTKGSSTKPRAKKKSTRSSTKKSGLSSASAAN